VNFHVPFKHFSSFFFKLRSNPQALQDLLELSIPEDLPGLIEDFLFEEQSFVVFVRVLEDVIEWQLYSHQSFL
jgi:hypothetical protein